MLRLCVALVLMVVMPLVEIQGGKRQFALEFSCFNCSASNHIAKGINCDLKRLAISRYSFNAYIEFRRELHPNADALVLLHYKLPKSSRVVKLLDIKVNICSFLRSAQLVPIPWIKDIVMKLYRNSNMPISCPVKANYLYNITNMMLSQEDVPAYANSMTFNLTITLLEDIIQLAALEIFGSIVPKSKRV